MFIFVKDAVDEFSIWDSDMKAWLLFEFCRINRPYSFHPDRTEFKLDLNSLIDISKFRSERVKYVGLTRWDQPQGICKMVVSI